MKGLTPMDSYEMEPEPGLLEVIFGFVTSPGFLIALAVLFLIITMTVITPGKTAKVIERFGKPQKRARMPGLSFKFPWPIDSVVGEVSLQLQEINANVSVKTSDNAFISLPATVQYRASDDSEGAVRAYYELEEPETQIESYVLNSIRSKAAGMSMDDLYKDRDDIEAHVLDKLREQFIQYGYIVVNVLIDEPVPSDEVVTAFNNVIASERMKQAATNVAEAKRIELVGIATAEKESKKLQGEGIADMRKAIAGGIEASIAELEKSMTREQALFLLMDTNRLDTLGSAAAHGNMILVDMQGGPEVAKMLIAARAGTSASSADTLPAS